MTLALYVRALLIAAGALESSRFDPRDLDEVALMVAEACDDEAPALPPHGRTCAEVAISLWGVETGHTYALYPRATSGCGPLQVLPLVPRPRARWSAGPCDTLRVPREGFRAGVALYRIKLAKARGSEHRAVRWYNGSPRQGQYERAAGAVLRRLRRVTREAAAAAGGDG